MSEQAEAAQVLEDAADLLLIRGVCRDGSFGDPGGPRCVYGALTEAVSPGAKYVTAREHPAMWTALKALIMHLLRTGQCDVYSRWNDSTTDDFEVIDTLRHVAKDLRNEAVQ